MKKYLGLLFVILLAAGFVVVIELNPFSSKGVGPLAGLQASPLTRSIDSLGAKPWDKDRFNSLKSQVRMETAAGELDAADTVNYFTLLNIKYGESLMKSYNDWKEEGMATELESIAEVMEEIKKWKVKHSNSDLDKAVREVEAISDFIQFQKRLDGAKRKEFNDSLMMILSAEYKMVKSQIFGLDMSDLNVLSSQYNTTLENYRTTDAFFKQTISNYRYDRMARLPCSNFKEYKFYRDSLEIFKRKGNHRCDY